MEGYGTSFRALRIEKGFSLKEVASGIMSVTALSNYENDISDVKAANLFKLLARMNISVSEFMFFHDKEGTLDAIKMTRTVEGTVVTNRRPTHKIKEVGNKYLELYNETGERNYQYISILCDYLANPDGISESKKDVVRSYIFDVQRFDEFEFYLLANLGDFFDAEELLDIYDQMAEDFARLSTYTENKGYDDIFNRVFRSIRYKDVENGKVALKMFYNREPKSTFENAGSHFIATFLSGLLMLCEGNIEGETMCRSVLNALDILHGYDHVVDQLDKWIDYSKDIGNLEN